ncbi:hypothetical protein CDV31_017169, partial [Fusarium ambrosium]
MTNLDIIQSLGQEQLTDLIKKYGAQALKALLRQKALEAAGLGSQVYTDYVARQAYAEQGEAFKELGKAATEFSKRLQSKEIRIVHEAFNSSSVFTIAFQSAAVVAISLTLLSVDDAIKRVGSALEDIRNELAIANVAKVQGWDKYGFGGHVHGFVAHEMAAVKNSKNQHYFYVWHPDTDWYQKFDEKREKKPLGPNFGGYNSDLNTICLRMSSDRAALTKLTKHGPDAIFHLLIPTYFPIVMSEPVAFHDSLLPLVITGQTHREANFVWFVLRDPPEELTLRSIGTLIEDNYGPLRKYQNGSVISSCIAVGGMMACGLGSTFFPPCAPVAMTIYQGLGILGMGSFTGGYAIQ